MQTTKLSKLKHSPSTELMSFTSRYFLCIQNSADILLKCQHQTDSFNFNKIRKIHIYNFIKAHNLFKRDLQTPFNFIHQTPPLLDSWLSKDLSIYNLTCHSSNWPLTVSASEVKLQILYL